MGMEDFGVHIYPKNSFVLKSDLVGDLISYGFVQDDIAVLSSEKRSSTFEFDNDQYILEAQVWVSNNNNYANYVKDVSVRFVHCQPPQVRDGFFEVVFMLCSRHNMIVKDAYSNDYYNTENFEDFRQSALSKIQMLRDWWLCFFDGDAEELRISTKSVWRYFFAKHPDLVKRQE
jgi:hypothetical protein